jgi:hypothetical protein
MHASPSTVEASTSPLQTPSAHPATIDSLNRRPEGPRMRSQIACSRCRRSKTKCDNDGGKVPCKSCAAGNKVCEFPKGDAITSTTPSHRRESVAGQTQNEDVSSFLFVC